MNTKCCPEPNITHNNLPWVNGHIETNGGFVPIAATQLSARDIAGRWRVRWAIGRDRFTVPPGLYAVGNPDKDSHVVVTANYKMSFDYVRQALHNRNAWILVLNTNGINVWCAAGKGSFSTDELVLRINETKLDQIVRHKRIILPQLGASGVSAKATTAQSGFTITFGPVRASDLPRFIDNGLKAPPEMRLVRFGFVDRLILIPVEFILAGKYLIAAMLTLMALSNTLSRWLGPESSHIGMRGTAALLSAWFAGSVLAPLALPILPGRAFSSKGAIAGLIASGTLCTLFHDTTPLTELTAWILIASSISSFIAMNFTGTSTYTSPSGVRKEMKYAVPCQLTACITGLVLLTVTFLRIH